MENLITLVVAALPLMGTPGPVTMASAAAGAAWPRRVAALYVLGMTTGTLTVISLVAAGLSGLVLALPGVAPVLAAGAAAYILYLAWKIANAPPMGSLERGMAPPAMFGGYAMAVANPKAWAAFTALFSGYPLFDQPSVAGTVLKVAFLAGLALAANLTWMWMGSRLAEAMQSPRASRALNVFFAVLLVVSVVLGFVL